ncbi:MAG: methyltransferase domain-containing protein [Candidatus Levybacteria bacterium]|nr:methyltransferase domain-containing protein [Candidatus Levybacteria bacterium]
MLELLIEVAFLIGLLYFIWLLVYSMAKGAPYAPMRMAHLEMMIKTLQIKKGEKAVDIGAGDGRVVIALARAGADAHGFEINPLLVLWGKHNIRRAGLDGKAHMHLQNFITADFSTFDVFTTYLTKYGMANVEKKLQKEAKKSARIAADFFPLPTWKASKHIDTIYLYEVSKNR